MREFLRSKIHKATVTDANVEYVGSITIDEDLLDNADMLPGEKVLVVSNTSGARLETYILKGERGSGEICVNGAAAHLIKKGEEVIILTFTHAYIPPTQTCILVDKNNKFVEYLDK